MFRQPQRKKRSFVSPPTNPKALTVLYLFAGPSRQEDLAWHLRAIGLQRGLVIRVIEVGWQRDASHDLLDLDFQGAVLADIERNIIDFVFLSPPCSTW